ncbi:MAG: ABC transporter permease [Candidatus Heimdallarchaeota archaeon]|nr:ABC transporter permease [Candidatus Heimdallarchaeota archaeon]
MSNESDFEENKKIKGKSFKIRMRIFLHSILASLKRIANHIGAISLRYFRSPSIIFWSILYPVLLVLLFGALFSLSANPNYELSIADLDDSDQSRDFIERLDNNTSLSIEVIDELIISEESWLKENNKDILLVIPSNWGLSLSLNTSSNITVFHDPSSPQSRDIIEIIEEVTSILNIEILEIEIKFGLIIDRYQIEGLSYIDSFVPGLIMISVSTIALFTGLNYDLEEKHSGILYKLSMTPGYRYEWILSKQIWQICLSLLASSLAILFALIYDFSATNVRPMMILFIIYGSMTFSGIAMILNRIISNPDGVMFASILIIVPQILFSGTLIQLDAFPTFILYIARIFPLYYLSENMRFLMLENTSQQFWLYYSISTVVAFVLFIIGIFVIKWRKE